MDSREMHGLRVKCVDCTRDAWTERVEAAEGGGSYVWIERVEAAEAGGSYSVGFESDFEGGWEN